MVENNSKYETKCVNSKDFSIEKVCKSNNLLKNLSEIIESHPDETAKNFGMSILHIIYDNYDNSLSCLEFVAAQHPEIPLIQRRIAEVYINQNNFQGAIPYLEKALELEEEDMTAKIWLSLSYFVTGETKKAKASLKSLRGYVFILNAANTNWDENVK